MSDPFTLGKRYMTRSGAMVEVVRRIDTGLTKYQPDSWKALGKVYLIVCRIIRYANGSQADPDNPCEICVHDDGFYTNEDHELDLIAEVQSLGKAA